MLSGMELYSEKEKVGVIFDETGIFCKRLSDLGEISLVLISDSECREYRIWKEMMECHHYLESSKLFGRQLKYLIYSSRFEYIGGIGFSSAAWRLEARDRLIGWSDEERRSFLNEVVCNSRFLILPWVKVKNLASHVLSQALSRLVDDWRSRYDCDPALVETFVDANVRSGTCYKAANWTYVGKTKGRGRNDSKHENPLSPKEVYVYELKGGFCRGSLPPTKESDWVEEEFQFAKLPNLSRKKRLLSLVRSFYAQPTENIPTACGGTRAKAQIKGAYRFFSDEKIQMEDILASHYGNTVRRAGKYPVVLAVQDSTSLKYVTHPATKGLGCLSSEEGNIGLMVHDTLALTPDGVPLGLLDLQVWARDPKDHGRKKDRKSKPIEEKESYKWLKSFEAVEKLSEQTEQTIWVSVGDREADIYELFERANSSKTHLLVRSIQNRRIADEAKLWGVLEKENSLGEIVLRLPKNGKRPVRDARLEVRTKKVDIMKPGTKNDFLALWAILVSEPNTSEGEEPLCWKLLTTLDVGNFEQAREKVEWYSARWGVEVFHRTLKSGCKVEDRQFGDAERTKRCLAIDLVIAWRILYLTMLGRNTPDVGCETFLQEAEWSALAHYESCATTSPARPPTLGEAVLLIAAMGGFVRGKGKEPGAQVMWRGLKRLHDMAVMYSILKRVPYRSEIMLAIKGNHASDDYG
jgi:hypothetical protein